LQFYGLSATCLLFLLPFIDVPDRDDRLGRHAHRHDRDRDHVREID